MPTPLPSLLQSAAVPILLLDAHGRVADANAAFVELSGYSLDQLQPHIFADPDELQRGVRTRTRLERQYAASSGAVLWLELSVSVLEGDRPSYLVVVQDSTQRKQTEEALRVSESRYRLLVDQAPLSIQILAPDGRTLRVNRAWEDLWGITLERLGGYNILEDQQLVSRGLMPHIRRAFDGEPAEIPASLYDPEQTIPDASSYADSRRWVRAVIYPIIDDGAVREVVLIHEDMTAQVSADRRLHDISGMLDRVVQQSGEAIVVSDEQGILRIFNPAAERLYGQGAAPTPKAEWTRRFNLLRMDGTPMRPDEAPLYRALQGQESRNIRWMTVRPDGERRSLIGTASPVTRADGSIAGAVLVVRDDTDRLAAESERERLLADAQAASRVKDEFLATLSHELRTPLNAILGWVQILRTRASGDQTLRGLAVIERNATAQAQLIEDLLDVSRIVTGKVEIDRAAMDLAAVAEAAVESIRPAADAKGLRLVADIERPLAVAADAMRIQQVLSNVLSNAVKFTPPGGEVRLTAGRGDGTSVEVVVGDTGIGIAPEILPKIFERFTQGDASTTRAHAGLGLGLAIARHLVELHGGGVSAESPGPGGGTTIRIVLPAG